MYKKTFFTRDKNSTLFLDNKIIQNFNIGIACLTILSRLWFALDVCCGCGLLLHNFLMKSRVLNFAD